MAQAMTDGDYDFPADLNEAEQELRDLTFEIEGITGQLGSRDKRSPEGERLTGDAYFTWRHKALGAMRHMLDEQRALKDHVRRLRANRPATPGGFGSSLRERVYVMVRAHREGRSDEVGVILDELAVRFLDHAADER